MSETYEERRQREGKCGRCGAWSSGGTCPNCDRAGKLARLAAALVVAVGLMVVVPEVALAGEDDVWEITIWDDDPVRGAETCRQYVIEYAPAVCHVEPEWMAPDVTQPGWANSSGPGA